MKGTFFCVTFNIFVKTNFLGKKINFFRVEGIVPKAALNATKSVERIQNEKLKPKGTSTNIVSPENVLVHEMVFISCGG